MLNGTTKYRRVLTEKEGMIWLFLRINKPIIMTNGHITWMVNFHDKRQ
jgi:hypothetical protein